MNETIDERDESGCGWYRYESWWGYFIDHVVYARVLHPDVFPNTSRWAVRLIDAYDVEKVTMPSDLTLDEVKATVQTLVGTRSKS